MAKETTRKCIASGEILNKKDLLRFVILEDNTVVPDFKKKLPGKGIYVKNAKSLLEKAIKNYINWYNSDRVCKKLNGLSPINFRKQALNCVSIT